MSYEDRLNEAKFRLQRNVHLPKGQSKAVLINDCPYCQEYRNCSRIIKDDGDHVRMLCKIRSNEIDAVWLNIRADDRPVVRVGDRFGKLSVVAQDRPDESGKLRWLCLCDCGKHKVVRGDNLIGENITSCGCSRGGDHKSGNYQSRRKVTVTNEEEKNNTCSIECYLPSRPAIGNESKTGKSIDVPISLDFDGEVYRIEVSGLCDECGGKIRFDDRGYKICESCGVEAAPAPDLSALPGGLKISDINAQYAHLSPQESFACPPDDDLKRFMLINMSDYIDHRGGEWGSVQQVVFDPINKCEPRLCYDDLCSGKRDFPPADAVSCTSPDTNHDYLAEFKAWCDDLLSKSIRPS